MFSDRARSPAHFNAIGLGLSSVPVKTGEIALSIAAGGFSIYECGVVLPGAVWLFGCLGACCSALLVCVEKNGFVCQ